MAITVDGYGPIHKGNAKEIYLAYNRGEVTLNKAQETKCKSYLSPEEMDEIAYDEQVKAKTGAEKINTDGTEKDTDGNKWGTGVGASAAGIGGAVGGLFFAQGVAKVAKEGEKASISVWSAIVACAIVAAGAIGSILLAKNFDNAYKERTAARDSAGNTNQTIDGYTNGLAGSMEMMNEDVELYKEQSAELTTVKNEQTSRGAELQMEYDTAMAMGDKAGAEKAKAEMQKLAETDNSKLEEGLEETGGALEEYRAMNVESAGVSQAGQSVSDFLKEGKGMGWMAAVNGALLGIAGIVCTLAATKSAVAAKLPWEIPVGLSAAVIYGIAAAGMLASAGIMIDKAGNEFQCGSAGDDMQTHVSDLNSMMEQQTQYTDDTEATYAETDDASAESQAEAGKQAAGATAQNKENLGNKPKSEKEEKEKVGAPVIV